MKNHRVGSWDRCDSTSRNRELALPQKLGLLVPMWMHSCIPTIHMDISKGVVLEATFWAEWPQATA